MSANKIYLVSDAHLGANQTANERTKEERLLAFLDHVAEQRGRLIICGDLFDFWFEYRHVLIRRHFRVVSHLYRLTEAGISVDYLAGNHDFWMGSFLEKELGIVLHPNELVLNSAGKKFYLRHGDGLLPKDRLYRMLKKVLRHPLNILLYRLLHPDIGIPLALFFSQWSRDTAQNKPRHSDAGYRQFAYARIDEGYDIVVLGHSHVAACQPYKQGWYVNPGAWMAGFTYALLEEGLPQLYKWDGERGHPLEPDASPRPESVLAIE